MQVVGTCSPLPYVFKERRGGRKTRLGRDGSGKRIIKESVELMRTLQKGTSKVISTETCSEGKKENMNFENLSPELQEKAKACQTPEELLALAKKEGYRLSEEELDGVAGGWSCDSFGERSDCHLNQWYE